MKVPGAGTPDLYDILVRRMSDRDRAGEVTDRFFDWYDTQEYGPMPPMAPGLAAMTGMSIPGPLPGVPGRSPSPAAPQRSPSPASPTRPQPIPPAVSSRPKPPPVTRPKVVIPETGAFPIPSPAAPMLMTLDEEPASPRASQARQPPKRRRVAVEESGDSDPDIEIVAHRRAPSPSPPVEPRKLRAKRLVKGKQPIRPGDKPGGRVAPPLPAATVTVEVPRHSTTRRAIVVPYAAPNAYGSPPTGNQAKQFRLGVSNRTCLFPSWRV